MNIQKHSPLQHKTTKGRVSGSDESTIGSRKHGRQNSLFLHLSAATEGRSNGYSANSLSSIAIRRPTCGCGLRKHNTSHGQIGDCARSGRRIRTARRLSRHGGRGLSLLVCPGNAGTGNQRQNETE